MSSNQIGVEGEVALEEALLISKRRNEAKQKVIQEQLDAKAALEKVQADLAEANKDVLGNGISTVHEPEIKQQAAAVSALEERIATLEAEKQQMAEKQRATMEVERKQRAALQEAIQRATAMETKSKQQAAQLSILEGQIAMLEAERQPTYKVQLDAALSPLSAVEERAQTLAIELDGARIYLEMARESEAILRRNQSVYLAISLACIVALFAVFFAKLIGAT